LKKKVWGASPAHAKTWERIAPGDLLFLYAMAPVKGVFGCAKVVKTFVDEKPLWPQELEDKQVLWPFRMSLEIETVLPPEQWETKRVTLERGGIVFQRALQPVGEDKAQELLRGLKKPARS